MQTQEIVKTTISKIGKKLKTREWNGIGERKTYKFLDKDIENVFVLFFISKKSIKEISFYYNVSTNTIREILKGNVYKEKTPNLIQKYKDIDYLSLPNEIWRDILDFENYYQVSNLGRVKYLSRTDKNGKFWANRICKQHICGEYLAIRLSNPHKKISKEIHLHRLLAVAFIPNPENKPCVNHKNLNKLDNSINNLEWVTFKENTNHAINNSACKHLFGKNHWQSKFTQQQVDEIRDKWLFKKITSPKLAEEYNVSESCIQYIVSNKNWVNPEYGILLNSLYKDRQYFHSRGENNPTSILNEKQVLEIREKYITNNFTKAQLARDYKVSESAIYCLLDGRTWKHI
jgi:predicted DNA-binding protein YlxM (UPF0122 family)